jgi:hypothetical protein
MSVTKRKPLAFKTENKLRREAVEATSLTPKEKLQYHQLMITHHTNEYAKHSKAYQSAPDGSPQEKMHRDKAKIAKVKLEQHKKMYDEAMSKPTVHRRAPTNKSTPAYWNRGRDPSQRIISGLIYKRNAFTQAAEQTLALLTANRKDRIGDPVAPIPKPAAAVKPAVAPIPKPSKPVLPNNPADRPSLHVSTSHRSTLNNLSTHLKATANGFKNPVVGKKVLTGAANAARHMATHMHHVGEALKVAGKSTVDTGKEGLEDLHKSLTDVHYLKKRVGQEASGYLKTASTIPGIISGLKATKEVGEHILKHHAMPAAHHLVHMAHGFLATGLAVEGVREGLEAHNHLLENGFSPTHAAIGGALVGGRTLLAAGIADHFMKGKIANAGGGILEKIQHHYNKHKEGAMEGVEAMFRSLADGVKETAAKFHIAWVHFAEKLFGRLADTLDSLANNYSVDDIIDALAEVDEYEKKHGRLDKAGEIKMAKQIIHQKRRSGGGNEGMAMAKAERELPLETRANIFSLDPKEQERKEAIAAKSVPMRKCYSEKELKEAGYKSTKYTSDDQPSYGFMRKVAMALDHPLDNIQIMRMEDGNWKAWIKPKAKRGKGFKDQPMFPSK